ncbi:hypothetical protein [Pontimicrobium sp. MEBiC01747]|jgi:hypothetical protein
MFCYHSKLIKVFLAICMALVLQSCYSIRLMNTEGERQPDPVSEREDDYRNVSVVEIDTTLTIKATTRIPTFLIKKTPKCKSGQLHTVEYRNTFGGVLLSAVTLGRKRRMKVKYVCVKPSN